jgi:hypothetical protein
MIDNSTMQYTISKYTPALRDQILLLQTQLWSPDFSTNSNYLEWKYERNPYNESPNIIVAICEDQVVGMRGLYGGRWRTNHGKDIDIFCAGDTVISQEHRNSGLLAGLIRSAIPASDTPYICSLSTGYLTFLNSLALGWRCAGFLETMYRGPSIPQRPSFPEKRLFTSSEDSEHPFYKLDRCYRSEKNISLERTPDPAAMAELVKEIGADGRITHCRDEAYFRWRFQNPLSNYRFLSKGSSKLEGYLVLQSAVYSDRKTVSIVDWEAVTSQVQIELLKSAISYGNFDCLMIWASGLPISTKNLVQECGFQYLPHTQNLRTSRHTLLLKRTSEKAWKEEFPSYAEMLSLENWNLRMLYSDGF